MVGKIDGAEFLLRFWKKKKRKETKSKEENEVKKGRER